MSYRKLLGSAALATLLIAGCQSFLGPDDLQVNEQDLAALKEMILTDPQYTIDPAILHDGDAPSFAFSDLAKTATPIIPITWGRTITHVARDVDFAQANDTTMIATLTHTIEGTVFIIARRSAQDTARIVVRKPFTEETVKKIKFYRTTLRNPRADSTRQGWKPAEVSAVKGGTTNSSVTITRMDVTVGTTTITITDPTEYFMKLMQGGHGGRPPILYVGPRQTMKVRLTLTSADPDTDWVALHRPMMLMGGRPDQVKPANERLTMVSQTPSGTNYQRVYEGTWVTNVMGNLTFFVSALTRSSLYDDQARFSSQIWGMPYSSR